MFLNRQQSCIALQGKNLTKKDGAFKGKPFLIYDIRLTPGSKVSAQNAVFALCNTVPAAARA
jgi:hypothetical protein